MNIVQNLAKILIARANIEIIEKLRDLISIRIGNQIGIDETYKMIRNHRLEIHEFSGMNDVVLLLDGSPLAKFRGPEFSIEGINCVCRWHIEAMEPRP